MLQQSSQINTIIVSNLNAQLCLLVIGYAAINDGFLARVHNDIGQLDGRIGPWYTMQPLILSVPFYQILERNLLQRENEKKAEEYSVIKKN